MGINSRTCRNDQRVWGGCIQLASVGRSISSVWSLAVAHASRHADLAEVDGNGNERARDEYLTAYAPNAMSDRPDEQQRGMVEAATGRQPCPMCQSLEPPIDVHGHSQCATCKINIDPCCGGAAFDLPAAS